MSRPVRLIAAAALAVAGLSAVGGGGTGAAAEDPLYRPVELTPSAPGRVAPERYHAVRVDLDRARALLRGAPRRADRSATVFEVPTPTGGTERFAVHRTRTMESGLAAAHPEITTYAGRSLDRAHTTIALDITPLGMHAAVRGPHGQGAWYLDPADPRTGTAVHLSYYGAGMPRAEEEFVEREAPQVRRLARLRARARATAGGEPVTQKVYRLAFLTDPSYFEYFDSDPAKVLAAKVTLVNRVNQIYNDDLAIRMVLVDETEQLSLETDADAIGPDGPCGAHPCFDADPGSTEGELTGHIDYCDIGTLGRNRIVLGQLIGASSYDIGHIGLGKNGGGIAYVGVAGWDYKGGGCTGLPQPKGDFYAIDYVAHELGHQFSANHTYFACGGTSNGPTGVEPGSGSTVMAYAGICGPDDLQPHTDPYFSAATVDEITDYTGNDTLPTVEVQTVSLRDFSAGETLTLGFNGETESITFEAYDAGTVETVVEDLTGQDVTIAPWDYDPLGVFEEDKDDHGAAPVGVIDPTGFQVIFAPSPNPEDPGLPDGVEPTDQPAITVSLDGDASGFVGETAQGGVAKNGGDEQVATGNTSPTAKAPANRTIPVRTPFRLKGSGKDADGGRPTLLWEQVDTGKGAIALVDNKKVFGPLFRVFGEIARVTDEGALESPSPGQNTATTNGIRTFPDLAQVLRGNTNARTGRCPRFQPSGNDPVPARLVDCYSEFLPTRAYRGTPGKARAMHFRLTARDGFPDGGGLGYDEVTLRIRKKAGPFLVRSFNKSGASVRGGRPVVVRWQVNGTKRLAKKVRIRLSTDNGKTWKSLRKTPNDGRAKVRFPRKRTKQARIMVEAVGNYFFDVNDKPFRIRR